MNLRTTHTFAVLELSQGAYDEIADKLRDACYAHTFQADDVIDMHGIAVAPVRAIETHKLDTEETVLFYEQDFYVLSNFSAFAIVWNGMRHQTSEHLYHWCKFESTEHEVAVMIFDAPSAHVAFKIAETKRMFRRGDWDDVKVPIMKQILRAKADQHEYVRRKLLATGNRTLVEDSWRDSFWGWGADRKGENMLGKLWMEVRAELRAKGA